LYALFLLHVGTIAQKTVHAVQMFYKKISSAILNQCDTSWNILINTLFSAFYKMGFVNFQINGQLFVRNASEWCK